MEKERDNQAEINIVILLSTKQGFALFFSVLLPVSLSPKGGACHQAPLLLLRRAHALAEKGDEVWWRSIELVHQLLHLVTRLRADVE